MAAAVCLALATVSAVLAAYDLWKVATIAAAQLRGAPAEATDFLNLYAGAHLFLTNPASTYDPSVQLALQQSLTARDSPLVPFYLPPYAAALVSWLAWLRYPVAYLVWLALGLVCLALAAHWLAPRWTRFSTVLWQALMLLFLPCLLGLAQGQTSALMLACVTALTAVLLNNRQAPEALGRGRLVPTAPEGTGARPLVRTPSEEMRDGEPARAAPIAVAAGLVGLALKPQLAPVFAFALLLDRRWRGLAVAALVVALLSFVALLRLGPTGQAAYSATTAQKLVETLTADPTFLLGPTLLHASHWYLGVNATSTVLAAALDLLVVVIVAALWRHGLHSDARHLLQLAILPVAAVIVAPYALVYELTSWLATFWLLWRFTTGKPTARSVLLWLTAAIWLAGDVGVALPLAGGADAAALLGLLAVTWIGWLYRSCNLEPSH